MVYISPEEAAKKWQVNKRRVQAYCSEGKIPGAFRMGRQWMVPIEAEKPMDGRQKQARSSADFANYHFPIFAFSSAYSSQDALCEEEKEILKAQIATLQGNYLEALSICRPLTENASTLSIRLGAVFTSAYNCILLGLYTDLCSYLSTMEEYAAQKTVYSEDIKLLATICRFQFSFDTHLIHTIDFTKLTSEALTVFQLFQMQSSIFESNKETATAVTFFASLAQTFKLSGITPAVIFLYSVLSLHYGYLGDTETKSKYIAEACHLAFENKYYTQLSK